MRAEMVRLLMAVTAPLVAVIAIGVYYDYRDDYRDTEATARRIVDATVADTEAFMKDARVKLEALAQRPLVREMNPQHCDPALKDLLSFSPRYLNIIVVDREGYFACAALPPPGDRRVRVQDLEMQRRIVDERRFQISRPLQGGLSGRWTVALAAPVLAGDGSAAGAVGVSVDLVAWPFIARNTQLPAGTVIGVIASDGTVVARSEKAGERVGRSARGIESVDVALARREVSGRGKARDGRDVIFAYRAVSGTDWIVLAGIPVGTAFVDSYASLLRGGAFGGAAMLLAWLIALPLQRRITGQVRRIAQAARRVAGGASGERAPVESIAEVAEVATQFNAMLDAQEERERERARLLERLQLQLERMPILCVMYDENLLVSYVNPTAVRTLGWSREELIGRAPFDTFITPERRATVESVFARLRAGEYVRAAGEGRCKDGSRILLEWVNTPLHREDGTFIGLMAMAQDVTENARAQALIADSERRYRLMFDANPLPMWVLDRGTLEFLAVNEAALKHYGYAHEEFLAMTVFDIRPPEDRERVIESARGSQELMQRGARKHLKKGGVAIDVEIASQDIEFAGRPARIVLAHDVTDKLQAERALRDSEERFRALAALSADGFWEQDDNFRYTSVSQGGVLERQGVAREGVIGRAPWELPGVESLDGGWDAYRALLAAHLAYRDHRFRVTLPDGTVRYATASGEPRFAPDGRFVGYRGVSSDVTARVRAEEALRELNAELEDRVRQRTAQLEEANRELEAFSYSVSHDLRSPLRHIDGFARRLEKALAGASAPVLRDLGIIRGAAKRMGELIDDLLNLSRTARAPVNLRRVELDALARELAAQTSPDSGAPAIHWQISDMPAVRADPSLMRIVLQNLISNAVKYSRKRAVAEIEIGARRDAHGETVVYVRDNGVGFDMRFAEKLFGVFQRLHREEDFEGTGVGLATVRRILHRHGARIWAESAPGSGATFSFTVTVAGAEA